MRLGVGVSIFVGIDCLFGKVQVRFVWLTIAVQCEDRHLQHRLHYGGTHHRGVPVGPQEHGPPTFSTE